MIPTEPKGRRPEELEVSSSAPADGPIRPPPRARPVLVGMEALDPRSPDAMEAARFAARLQSSRPRATMAILGGLALVFAAESYFGGSESFVTLARMGANVVERTRAGELERILAASTLHAGAMHMLVNGYVLWSLGRVVEALFGSARLLVLYASAALVGGLATTLFGDATSSVGASGAVWGLLVGMGVLAFRPAGLVPRTALASWRRTAITNLVLNVMISFLPGIDLWAHFGGGLAGAVLVGSGVLTAGLSLERPVSASPYRAIFAVLGAIGMIAIVASVAIAWARGRPWELALGATYERVELTDLGVSLEVPSIVASESRITSTAVGPARSFGGRETDPWALFVLATPSAVRLADQAALEARVSEAYAQLNEYMPADGAVPVGAAQRGAANGNAIAWRAFTYPNGLTYVRMIVVTDAREVLLEVVGRPEHEDAQAVAARIAGSIRPL